jgi:hypothetical protein
MPAKIWIMLLVYLGHPTTADVAFPAFRTLHECIWNSRQYDKELSEFGLYFGCEGFHVADQEE